MFACILKRVQFKPFRTLLNLISGYMSQAIPCDQFSRTETRYGIILHRWKRNWVRRWVNGWKHLSRQFRFIVLGWIFNKPFAVDFVSRETNAKLFINCASASSCFLAFSFVCFSVDRKCFSLLTVVVAVSFPENVFWQPILFSMKIHISVPPCVYRSFFISLILLI